MSRNVLTPDDAERFDFFIKKWQRILNLQDWRITRSLKPAKKGYMAEVDCNGRQKLATYFLGEHFSSTPVNDESLEATALHELLHVRLYDLLTRAYAEQCYSDDVQAVEHSLINLLETLLLEAYGEKRPCQQSD